MEFGELEQPRDFTTVRVFTSMIAAPSQAHAVLGLDVGSPEQQRTYIERAVDILLEGVGKR